MAIDFHSLAEQSSPIVDTTPPRKDPSDPPPSTETKIDKALLLNAWQRNIETQSELTRTVQEARRSNMLTRYIVITVALLVSVTVIAILTHIQHKGIEMARSVGRVEALAESSHGEVVIIREHVQNVVRSVVRSNVAAMVQEEANVIHAAKANVASKKRELKIARMSALAASLDAQEAVEENPDEVQKVRDLKVMLRNQVAKEGIDLDL